VIDGCLAATSLSPKIYLAHVQMERFSISLLVHHPITINRNYISSSHCVYSLVQGSVIKDMVKEIDVRTNNNIKQTMHNNTTAVK
uniref:Uncharacterized protein n=1 Tax=Panthera leo TaxID=9689 RepID=A0A8C8Y9Y6_PANLE